MEAARETTESGKVGAGTGVAGATRSSFIKQFHCPEEESGVVCFPFWELVAAAGCPYKCAYCFLQGTLSYVFGHYPLQGAIFQNWRDMIAEVERWLECPTPRMLVLGELQDGLAFDGAYKRVAGRSLTEMLIPLFAAQRKHKLLFLTKSVLVRYARAMRPSDQVIFSWSVNAVEAARRWELRAPSPLRRLEAARTIKDLGWPIRLRLDPMIPFPGWQVGYAEIIERINELSPESVTVGALRASSSLPRYAKSFGRDTSVFDLLTTKDPGGFKKRLPDETHMGMLRFAVERLDRSNVRIALCKEHRSVWSALGLRFQGCHCLLEHDDLAVEREGPLLSHV